MIIPLLMLLGGFVTVRAVVHHVQGPFPKTKIGAVSQTQRLTKRQLLIKLQKKSPHLFSLMAKLKRGDKIDPWLVASAMREAYDHGDVKTVAKLHHKFGNVVKTRQIETADDLDDDDEDEIDEESGEPREPDDDDDDDEESEGKEDDGVDKDHQEDGDYMPDGDPDDGTNIVIGKETIEAEDESSPLEGIDKDSWDDFVSRMETQAPTFVGPSHVGRFHHSKLRLKQLGIDDVSTAEKQLDAFATDIEDLRERGEPLIKAWECHPIKVGDSEQVATLSGILAVLKSAGIEKARSWFESETDRKKFAKTTEMFTKANGAF